MLTTADTTSAIDSGLADTGETKTPPHVRLRKAAHDTILAYHVPRMRTPMLAVYVALLRAENDSRAARNEAFTVSIAEIARLSGMSARSVHRVLPALDAAELLATTLSGRTSRTENTYRLLSPGTPPRRALASAPASSAEVEGYVLSKGWEIPADTSREFFAYNEARQWMIPDATGKRFNHCRDWRKLLAGWIETHGSSPPVPSTPPDPATPATGARVRREPLDSTNISASASGDPQSERIQLRVRTVGALKRRQAATQWTAKERAAFKAAGLDTMSDDDFAAQLAPLAAYYDESALPRLRKFWQTDNPEKDFRRRDLATLLNNWPTELDRAQDFARWRRQRREEAASDRL